MKVKLWSDHFRSSLHSLENMFLYIEVLDFYDLGGVEKSDFTRKGITNA